MQKSIMLPSISSNSTLTELLSVIRLAYERKECNEAEKILIRREENFRNEIKDLRRQVENHNTERPLLEKLRELTETRNNFEENELQNRKLECEELSERINRLIDEHKSLVDGKIQAEEMHIKAMHKVKRAEIEGFKKIAQLKRKNDQLEEDIIRYKDIFQQRISKLEETVADLLGIDVSDVRKGNHQNPNSCRTSKMGKCSNYSGGNHSSPRHNQEFFADSCDIDVCKRKPVVSSPIAAADGPNCPIVITDTDDETAADACDINLSSVNRMCSVNTEERDTMKDSSFILLHGRKRSLIKGDEDNRSPMSRQKTQDTEQIFSDDKDSSNTVRSKFRKAAWESAANFLSEFERNYELCMMAVCVLYRRTISTSDSFSSTTLDFSHFVASRGKELAEFLIKGDQKHRLRRSVAEVKKRRPEVLVRCRELATWYNEKLFEIYRKGEDPFFCYLTKS